MIMVHRIVDNLNYKEEDVWDKTFHWFLTWMSYFIMEGKAKEEEHKKQQKKKQ